MEKAIGIDVGGPSKGFHAVAMVGTTVVDTFTSTVPAKLSAWCRKFGAPVIAVDAPSAWSLDGNARSAEIALMGEGIWCFSTPTRAIAVGHPKRQFAWMLAGEALYASLTDTHPCFIGDRKPGQPYCIETFPHAVVCALAGQVVPARYKARVRRQALQDIGVDSKCLRNIDFVDAALCAVTANKFSVGAFRSYGDREDGLIVVPEMCGT